jgi:hypothetical protein
VELHDGLVGRHALVGDYVLARVVAFGGAVPKEELVEERWVVSWIKRKEGWLTDVGGFAICAVLLFADLRRRLNWDLSWEG